MCEYMILKDYIKKYIYNAQNGLWYKLQGDYYLLLGITRRKRRTVYRRMGGIGGTCGYIREHKRVLYPSALTSGKLQSYLADVEEQAQELFDCLMKQRAVREGITETLRADNQIEWGRQDKRSAVRGYGTRQ